MMFLFRLIQAILYSIPLSEPRIIGIVFMTPQTYKKTATKPNKIIKNIKKNDNPIKKPDRIPRSQWNGGLSYPHKRRYATNRSKILFLIYTKEFNMTQILVTLDNTADASLLRRMIENMKGVLATSVQSITKSDHEDAEEWLDNLHAIKKSINPDLIDMSDERTRYIMSK